MQMMLAATVERGDVVFCSSLSGNNSELIKAVRIAADYGASTIGLTVRNTPLADAVAVPLTIDIADDGDVLGADLSPLRLSGRDRHACVRRCDPQPRPRTGEIAAHQAAVHDLSRY